MEELSVKLNAIPDSYFGFVAGIMAYAKNNPNNLDKIIQFIDSKEDVTSSDVVEFVMKQPDFHQYGMSVKELAV